MVQNLGSGDAVSTLDAAKKPAIRVDHLVKRYTTGSVVNTVLDDVSLIVPPSQVVALKGVSGSGKSTMLHMLGAVDTPDSGTLEVAGVDLTTLDRRAQAAFRARRIGFVFQFFNLMPTLTAQENVESALEPLGTRRGSRAKRAAEILDMVGLGDQGDKFPAQLSGGQQQRVAIARALVKSPPVILADEPTGALDSGTAEMILELLLQLRADTGCTMVIATHDPIVSRFSDVVYHVGSGVLEPEP